MMRVKAMARWCGKVDRLDGNKRISGWCQERLCPFQMGWGTGCLRDLSLDVGDAR